MNHLNDIAIMSIILFMLLNDSRSDEQKKKDEAEMEQRLKEKNRIWWEKYNAMTPEQKKREQRKNKFILGCIIGIPSTILLFMVGWVIYIAFTKGF